ncbi:hypothetical protein [Desertifilum tharense]|nr:hypothetical protein [Desertifilum tharense]
MILDSFYRFLRSRSQKVLRQITSLPDRDRRRCGDAIADHPSVFTDIRDQDGLRSMTQLDLLPTALADLFAQVSAQGYITTADRYGLLAALLDDDSLSEEEKTAINRLLWAVAKKRIAIVEQISMTEN